MVVVVMGLERVPGGSLLARLTAAVRSVGLAGRSALSGPEEASCVGGLSGSAARQCTVRGCERTRSKLRSSRRMWADGGRWTVWATESVGQEGQNWKLFVDVDQVDGRGSERRDRREETGGWF